MEFFSVLPEVYSIQHYIYSLSINALETCIVVPWSQLELGDLLSISFIHSNVAVRDRLQFFPNVSI